MPVGIHDLDVDKIVKDKLADELFVDILTGITCLEDEKLDEYKKDLIHRSKYSYQELKKHFLRREKLNEEENKRIGLIQAKEVEKKRRKHEEYLKRIQTEAEERHRQYEEACRLSKLIGSKVKSMAAGTLFQHKKLGLCKIIEFRDSRVALIEYPDGHQGLVDIRGCFENGHINLEDGIE